MINYRKLTSDEILILEKNHCSADNWNNVEVVENFISESIKNTEFSGTIKLGRFEKVHKFWGGVEKPCGIYDAKIHNCKVGDNVLINKINNYIANYKIENDVIINNVGILAVNGETSFGNCTEVEVLNEAGGREVLIYEKLTAQIAYLLTFYRHDSAMVKNIETMIRNYCHTNKSDFGVIGQHVRILNSRSIRNMKIGEYTIIQDTEVLEDGTIVSKKEAPVNIGHGVYAKNFICQSGSTIADGAVVSRCFIGQGCEISKQFSAENSLFFANCGCFHGEACAIFAGPYTVTHHKSSLLIAGYFSFFNAGSGSNQSNHMYKLGPCHQGILERGAKTASDSYLLYPFKIGPFSLVMGRHYKHSDISDLPYSYLIESKDESILIPGVNLRSVGTIRDAVKWPKRDNRTDPDILDLINFDLLSPYTADKLIQGINILETLQKTSGNLSDFYTYNNVKIRNRSLKHGLEFYKIGLIKFLGNTLIKKLKDKEFHNTDDLKEVMKSNTVHGTGKWIDIAGMFAPLSKIEEMITLINEQKITSIAEINNFFNDIHENYDNYKWAWFVDNIQKHMEKNLHEITSDEWVEFIKLWQKTVLRLDDMYLDDCKKEFSPEIRVGYGIDGDSEIIAKDFAEVRGTYDKNNFVDRILNHKLTKKHLGDKIIEKLLVI